MIEEQVRYRLPADVVEAVRAAAVLERVSPATVIERAVRSYLGPAREIELAARIIKDSLVNFAEIKDMLNVIADRTVDQSVLIDQLSEENEALKAAAPVR